MAENEMEEKEKAIDINIGWLIGKKIQLFRKFYFYDC